jgi:hypothetical protein
MLRSKMNDMDDHNLPVPDDMPWVNLSQQEVEELRNKKHELTEYGKNKFQELMNKDAERKALEAVEKLYAENGDALKRLAEIERQEILDLAREGMVKYDEALKELKDK